MSRQERRSILAMTATTDPASPTMRDHSEPLANLSVYKPEPSFVVLDTFWARCSDLSVLKNGFKWNCTSWLGLELGPMKRYELTRTLAYDNEPKPGIGYGTYHLGDSESYSLYLIFPGRPNDLVEDDKLAGRFHDEILLPAYDESSLFGGSPYPKDWKMSRLIAVADRVEGMDPDAPDRLVTFPVHPNSCNIKQMWKTIQNRINTEAAFKTLKGVFPAVVYTPNTLRPIMKSTDEAWKQVAEGTGNEVDASHIVKDTIHAAFRTVSAGLCPRKGLTFLGYNLRLGRKYRKRTRRRLAT